jgi:hypothetical protein
MRSAFIAVQFAVSTLLLVAAGMFTFTMWDLDTMDRGFATDGVVTVDVNLTGVNYSPERAAILREQLVERLNRSPGITASLAEIVPLTFRRETLAIEAGVTGAVITASRNRVAPGHFGTLGIPLLAGRDFDPGDRLDGPATAIVNETLARRLWPGEIPLGKRFRASARDTEEAGPWIEVVGLAADSKYGTLDEEPTPFVYLPLEPAAAPAGIAGLPGFTRPPPRILARVDREVDARAAIWRELQELDAFILPPTLTPIEAILDLSYFAFRVLSIVGTILGAVALLLAAVGTYGVVAYLTAQRRFEIGVCVAVGATPAQIVRRITRPVMTSSLAGIAGGSVLTLALLRIVLASTGPIVDSPFVVAAAFLLAIGLLAGIASISGVIPTLRALRNDPVQALRN